MILRIIHSELVNYPIITFDATGILYLPTPRETQETPTNTFTIRRSGGKRQTMLTIVVLVVACLASQQQILPITAFAPAHARRATPFSSLTSTSLKLGDFFNFGKDKKSEEAAAPVAEETQQDDGEYYDEDDPIEKIFGVFFGKKEKNP